MSSTTFEHSRDRAETLPTSWNPSEVEADLYEGWVRAGYFTADVASSKPAYCIVLPPPNVNGTLHIGHALDHTLMDALTRRKRMQGYEVLWLPGTDHAGIATQIAVEKHLAAAGTSREELGREQFVEQVWAWKRQSGGAIGSQMRRLGDGVDFSRERFTMDEGLSRAVQTMFARLYRAGLIYRAQRLVNWSPALGSAISDIEVKYSEVEGELVSLRYGSLADDQPHVIVATTRVETMLGDTAVAVHPDDERYRALVGTTLEHPITGRQIPVLADAAVDPEFGTGAVKITPAHDPNDFEMGLRHHLPMPTIMDTSGHIADTETEFDGMDRFAARVAVRERLAAEGRVVAEKRPYVHSVGHSERTGEPIEPRLSMQWWVRVQSLAQAAGDAVRHGDTVLHPESQQPRWFAWVDDMRDWCISRQLWWGHRIPVWYGPDGEVVCVGPDEAPPEGYVQDPDVLDTWFSSALWPFSTLGWPQATAELVRFYPTSVLVTGYDILFFWVARMMMFAAFVADDPVLAGDRSAARVPVPFSDVLLHGLIRDEFGRKMSKSRGNGVDPLEWIDQYGADATRFALARGAAPGGDLSLGRPHAEAARNFVTKLFNATRFALLNGAAPAPVDRSALTDADRWILDRCESVRGEVDAAFDGYEIGKACQTLFHFTWDELCDWYLEMAKVQLAQSPQCAESTRAVLGSVLDTVLRLWHPIMPFVTEALWRPLTGGASLVVADWPEAAGVRADATAAQRIADMQLLVTEIRRFRSDQNLTDKQRVAARLTGLPAADLTDLHAQITTLAHLTEPGEAFTATAAVQVRVSATTITVELDTSGAVDLDAERRRVDKALVTARKELAGTTAKLGNDAFLAKAPEDVIAKIRTRREVAEAEVARLDTRLAELTRLANR